MSERILPRPAFVASIAPRDLPDARRLVAGVPERASAIEYRLDLAEAAIRPALLLELDPRPVLATWRTTAEGGGFSGSPEEYRRLTREAYAAGATVDVERRRHKASSRPFSGAASGRAPWEGTGASHLGCLTDTESRLNR